MSSVINYVKAAGTLALLTLSGAVLAQGGGDIAALAAGVGKQASAIATLLSVASYVAGVGFALAGILQFKAHKENPQQTPLSKPVVMIVVAACLLFLPTILSVAGASVFGGTAVSAGTKGGITPLSGS